MEVELRDQKGRCCGSSRGCVTLAVQWEGQDIPPPVQEDSVAGAVQTFLARVPDRKEAEHRFIASQEPDKRLEGLVGP